MGVTRNLPFGGWLVVAAVGLGVTGACSSKEPSASCDVGDESCACYPNGTCNGALSCLSQTCVDAGGASGGRAGQGGNGAGLETGDAGSGTDPGTSGGKANAQGGASSSNGGGGGSDISSTPVGLHGALSVSGTNLLDESGAPVKLEGMSSMWLNWDSAGYALSKEGLRYMRDNWNLRVFRAAMGIAPESEPTGAYLGNPAKYKEQVNQIVQNAIDLGVYVIIDWHDHEAITHRADAEAFFREMSEKWGGYPNVLYEVFNEPLDLNWATELKPYHQALVNVIRANDPDNIIILGTPNWDQDVDVAALSPLAGTNLMYTLHFYACTHGAAIRSKAQTARSRGLPMFVTEWGATHADGGVDGVVCESEARAWHDFLDTANISWTAWKLDGCTDSSCMFKDQTVPADGGWTSAQLNGHAPIVIDEMKNGPGSGSGGAGGSGGASGQGGATARGGSTGAGGSTSTDPFPPNPAGCALVTSCTGCCATTGVYALDWNSKDATSSYVTAFSASATSASADFEFLTFDEIGGIFFQLANPEEIGRMGVSVTGSGGSYEMALVSAGGANGCIYPIVGSSLSSVPDTCWGLGAGPYYGSPVEQIEVRLRSYGGGPATLTVVGLTYGP